MAYAKQCSACGKPFETLTVRQRKCSRECGRIRKAEGRNPTRTEERARHDLEFIGVDGEGVNVHEYVQDWDENGEECMRRQRVHHYVLLSAGSKSLQNDGKMLTHDQIFTFLWQQYQDNPKAAFVGFFLGYDFTNWLKTIPVHSAKALLTKEGIARRKPSADSSLKMPWPVRDGQWAYVDGHRKVIDTKWEFDILANKRFKLRPYIAPEDIPTRIIRHKDGTQETQRIPRPWMYVCDTGPFFQSSFLNAINPEDWNDPIVTPEEYEIIKRGKAHRQDAQLDANMLQYNVLENDVLARMMQRVHQGFIADGIILNRQQWFGPGQAAQAWMKLIGVPTGEQIREAVPRYARDAARATYYGGWFEIFNHGPVPGTSYAYDINSAYPAVIASLPCLLHGRWSQGAGRPPRIPQGAIRMVYATVAGNDPWIGAMPHRNTDGSILRPSKTKGWYWWHEVKAAQSAKLITKIDVHEWATYEPCQCPSPMASIAELYEGRLAVGKNTAAGKGKKLVYNSAYGKLAQSIGEPRFSNPIWASLITSGCRTMILDAIATHPTRSNSLLMIATDGIVFKEPHHGLDVDKTRLGAWDDDTYENLSLFMPGLYWDDKTREAVRKDEAPKLKSRGVAARDLAKVITLVDEGWNAYGAETAAPRIELAIEWGMTTAKQAIVRGKWHTAGKIVYGASRTLDGRPDAKRDPELMRMWGGLRSIPYAQAAELETTPYDKGFGETMLIDLDEAELVTPDGTIAELQAWAFRR